VNPWDDDGWAGPPQKRPRPSWGCALAAIIGSVATIVVIVIVVKLLASLINVGDLMP
jgi:hypothetical protein